MQENRLLIPISILIAVAIIIAAVFFSNKQLDNPNEFSLDNPSQLQGEEFAIRTVTADDHILGSLDADIVIVEYSDFECPFCANHHPTMERLIEDYGKDGKVAWVFRHYPFDQAHPKARPAAEASECVANLVGEAAFWEFSSEVFANQPASLTAAALKKTALDLGTDEAAYDLCVTERTYADDVDDDKKDGDLIASVDPQFGTPYNLLITKGGIQIPLRGAQPYEVFKQYIETLLQQPTSDTIGEETPEETSSEDSAEIPAAAEADAAPTTE